MTNDGEKSLVQIRDITKRGAKMTQFAFCSFEKTKFIKLTNELSFNETFLL